MQQHPPKPVPRRVQFGIRTLLLIMLLVSVLAAIGGGLARTGDGKPNVTLIVMAIAAPLGVMILLSLIETFLRLTSRYQQTRRNSEDVDEQV